MNPTFRKIGNRGLIAVAVDGKLVGFIRRTSVEVPDRRTYFPAMVTRIEWVAQTEDRGAVGTYTTRKAAAAALAHLALSRPRESFPNV